MCRVQTRPELAEEDGRDISGGSQQDQEHILRHMGKFGLKTPGGLWQSPVCEETAMDTLNHGSLPGLWQIQRIQISPLTFFRFYCCTKWNHGLCSYQLRSISSRSLTCSFQVLRQIEVRTLTWTFQDIILLCFKPFLRSFVFEVSALLGSKPSPKSAQYEVASTT